MLSTGQTAEKVVIVFVLRIAAMQFSVSADHIMSENIQRRRLHGAVRRSAGRETRS